MIKRTLLTVLAALATVSAAFCQSPPFPSNVPAQTVVGRCCGFPNAGPASAVPISAVQAAILYQETPVNDTNYTLVANDRTIAYTAITAARTVTLLPASSYFPGTRIYLLDRSGSASSSNSISVAPNGTDLINGANTSFKAISSAYGTTELESDGISKWVVTVPPAASSCNVRPSNETSYTAVSSDNGGCIVVTNVTNVETVTLPNAATAPFKVTVYVRSGQVTSAVPARVASGGGSFNGQTGPIDIPPYGSATFSSDSSNWSVAINVTSSFFGAAGLQSIAAASYSLEAGPAVITISGTCASQTGESLGVNYSASGFSPNPIQFRHTMTTAGTCLQDFATDILAQYKANAQLIGAYGADVISFSIAYPCGSAWCVGITASRPNVVSLSPSLAAVTGAHATVSVTSIPTGLEVGGGHVFVRSTKAFSDTIQVGDLIGGMYWCADTATKACNPRDLLPLYGQMQAQILNTSDTVPQASMTWSFDQFSFVQQNASATAFGIGTGTPKALLHLSANATQGLTPIVGSGQTPLFVTGLDGNPTIAELRSYGNGSIALPALAGIASEGTGASPSTIGTADYLLDLVGKGRDNSAFSGTAVELAMRPSGTWSTTDHQTRMTFSTTPAASTTLTEAMRINPSGGVSVGLTSDCGVGTVCAKSVVSSGAVGTSGEYDLLGSSSGTIKILPQAAAGSYNFNLPTTAGASGQFLTSAAGGSSPTTWDNISSHLTAGSGIGITGTTNATIAFNGACANLSDCTTGTWTPTIVSSGGGTPTYTTTRNGFYQKIGPVVVVQFAVSISALNTLAAGTLTISGLPFTAVNTTNQFPGCSFNSYTVTGLGAGNAGLVGFISPNTTVVNPVENGNTGTAVLTQAHFGATGSMFGWCIYSTL